MTWKPTGVGLEAFAAAINHTGKLVYILARYTKALFLLNSYF